MRVYFHVVVVIRAPVSSKPCCLLLQYTLWPRQRPLSLSQTMGNLWSCAQWMIDWTPPFCRFLQTLLRQEHPFNWALNWDRLVPVLETGEASIRFTAQERRSIRSTLVSEYCKAHQAALSPALECRTQGHSQCQGAILAAPSSAAVVPVLWRSPTHIFFLRCWSNSSVFEENETDLWQQTYCTGQQLDFSRPSNTMGDTFEVTLNSPQNSEEGQGCKQGYWLSYLQYILASRSYLRGKHIRVWNKHMEVLKSWQCHHEMVEVACKYSYICLRRHLVLTGSLQSLVKP